MSTIWDADQIVAREGHEIVKGRHAHRLAKRRPDIPADIPAEPSLLVLAWREYRAIVATVTRGGAR